jgi:hypothetical protein
MYIEKPQFNNRVFESLMVTNIRTRIETLRTFDVVGNEVFLLSCFNAIQTCTTKIKFKVLAEPNHLLIALQLGYRAHGLKIESNVNKFMTVYMSQ